MFASTNRPAWHRRASRSLAFGLTLIAAGMGAMLIGYLADARVDTWDAIVRLGHLGIIVGAIFGGISLLVMKGATIEEAYQLGYDLGHEKGFREASGLLADESVVRATEE